jgi:uncharacterized protein involved in exopolysaccharide biosynthesis
MTEQSNKKTPQVAEIDLSLIIDFIKKYFLIIGIIAFIAGIAGYAFSFLLAKSYRAQTVILPEQNISSGSFGSLSSLARLGGVTGGGTSGSIDPELYPTILSALPFGLYMLEQPVVDSKQQKYKNIETYLKRPKKKYLFFEEDNTSVPSSENTDFLNQTRILTISAEKEIYVRTVIAYINAVFNFENNTISISSEIDDPYVAAQIVDYATEYIVNYVTDYRTSKNTEEVTFLEKQSVVAKKREQKAELALQSYRDRNRNAFLNVAKIEEQRLQSEYTLAQSIYNDIVRKWEDAKIKLNENQPVIKIIEPVQVPRVSSKPRRVIVALIFAFVGGLISTLYFFLFKEGVLTRL